MGATNCCSSPGDCCGAGAATAAVCGSTSACANSVVQPVDKGPSTTEQHSRNVNVRRDRVIARNSRVDLPRREAILIGVDCLTISPGRRCATFEMLSALTVHWVNGTFSPTGTSAVHEIGS